MEIDKQINLKIILNRYEAESLLEALSNYLKKDGANYRHIFLNKFVNQLEIALDTSIEDVEEIDND